MHDHADSDAYRSLREALAALEQDKRLYDDDYFVERTKAIDFLEFEILDAVAQMNPADGRYARMQGLHQRAQSLKQRLDQANERLVTYLLTRIRAQDRIALKDYLRKFEGQISAMVESSYVGYDELDVLIWALLDTDLPPEQLQVLEPDMVYYQPSSARTILKLISELHTTPDDVFYDLGSGLGHVPILVHLLTDLQARGIEIQNFYCRYSNACLDKLGLSNITFSHADARDADYQDGTIFYMYTPFRGKVLRQVLAKLEAQAKRRPIQVCTFGPCTSEVAEQSWLRPIYHAGRLAIFKTANDAHAVGPASRNPTLLS